MSKKLKTTRYLTSFYLLKKLRLVYFGLNSRAIFNTFHFNQSLVIWQSFFPLIFTKIFNRFPH